MAQKNDAAPSTSELSSAKSKQDAVNQQTAVTMTQMMEQKVQADIDA